MKKTLITLLFFVFFAKPGFADSYSFIGCEIGKTVVGNYIINVEKNVIEVELKSVDGQIQTFSDKIKSIEKNKIISEKIKSDKGDNIYYQYFLNAETKSVIKLEFKREGDDEVSVLRISQKRESLCEIVKGGWSKKKIEKDKLKKEELEILKAQEKLKKEQEASFKCQGKDFNNWTNCNGSYVAKSGHEYTGIFKDGKIINGISLYPGGAQYIGGFKNNQPNNYGTFVWTNGDKYYGTWKNGKTHGTGTKIWSDGREYSGNFENDKLHGDGTFYYPDGKRYVGEFINGKRHGIGTFYYQDGTAFIGTFVNGKQEGLGECIAVDGTTLPCQSRADTQVKDFSGKDTHNISVIAKKWIRISHYETNSKKGKKILDKLKADFEIEAKEICSQKSSYDVLEKKMEVLEVDETPAYGLETKLKIGINGVVECK